MVEDFSATAFFVTPFSAESTGEDQETFEKIQNAVRSAADAVGVAMIRADDIFEPGVVIEQIEKAIHDADIVVALCTGKNPNVFYELGMARVVGHRPVLIARDSSDLPFDVQHLRALLYEGSLQDLPDQLEQAFRAAIDAGLRERPGPIPSDGVHLAELKSSKETFFGN